MFSTKKIYNTITVLPSNIINKIITEIHEKGICQVRNVNSSKNMEHFHEQHRNLESAFLRLRTLQGTIDIFKPQKKKKLIEKPHKKHPIKKKNFNQLITKTEEFLNRYEDKILRINDNIDTFKEQISQHNQTLTLLKNIPPINLKYLKESDSSRIVLKIGLIPEDAIQEIKNKIGKKCILTFNQDNNKLKAVIATSKEYEQEVNLALDSIGFEEISLGKLNLNKTSKETINEINENIDKLNRNIKKEIKKLAKIYHIIHKELHICLEECEIELDKLSAIIHGVVHSETFAAIHSWIPASKIKEYIQIIEKYTKNYYITTEETKNAPTLLKNPKVINSFELITELYSPPKYGHIDPTPILAFTLPLFFGFMLTDVVYGIILFALGLFIVLKLGHDTNMKHTGNILWVFGIFTIIMGVVFTSYLGDFFQRIGVAIPVIIDPMRQVMLALSIAVGIGVIHIIIGLVMGFIENVKLGKFLSALSTQGVWILFMIGIGILFLSINVGLTLIFVAIILEMFFKFKDGGIMASVLSVFGFSGFIGDIFSYARLMALGVGTAGIALAVNFLTLMSAESIPVIGIVIAILIFVVGHTFNMAMNGLGAFIHAVRLHFLEFFQKFYDGGGFSYAPFKAKREKTYIQN